MQYMGSKNRIANKLIPFILDGNDINTPYVEPFVGGGNMIDKIPFKNKKGYDSHKYLIALLRAAALGDPFLFPDPVSKDFYYEVKNSPGKYDDHVVGFVGFLCSFGGKWWGGYAANKKGTNYAETGANNLLKQSNGLEGIVFEVSDYRDIVFQGPSVIYCDPPYENTTSYKGGFDHDFFWDWCRLQPFYGHKIYISEYSAPPDFTLLTEVSTSTKMNKNEISPRTEKLFTLL